MTAAVDYGLATDVSEKGEDTLGGPDGHIFRPASRRQVDTLVIYIFSDTDPGKPAGDLYRLRPGIPISCSDVPREKLAAEGQDGLPKHNIPCVLFAEYEGNLRYFLTMGIHPANDYVIVFNQVWPFNIYLARYAMVYLTGCHHNMCCSRFKSNGNCSAGLFEHSVFTCLECSIVDDCIILRRGFMSGQTSVCTFGGCRPRGMTGSRETCGRSWDRAGIMSASSSTIIYASTGARLAGSWRNARCVEDVALLVL